MTTPSIDRRIARQIAPETATRPHGLRGDDFVRYVIDEWAKDCERTGDVRTGPPRALTDLMTTPELARLADILEAEQVLRETQRPDPNYLASKCIPGSIDLARHMRDLPRRADLDLPTDAELHPDRPKVSSEAFAALYQRSTFEERRKLVPLMTLADIEVCQAVVQVEMNRIDGHALN